MKPSLTIFLSTLILSMAAVANPALETAQADYREIPLEHRLDGVVEAVNRGTLSAQTQGQVLEILVDVDDYVKQDSVIIHLNDTEHKARLNQARAELSESVARLKEAEKEQRRIASIHERKLVSGSTLDQANAALEAAKARNKSAQAGLEQAHEQLRYTQIKAPFSGIVTQRHIEVGETANPGQKLISGLSLDKLRVNVDVPQSLIPTIRNSGKARIYIPGDSVIEAKELTIFPYAQAGSNTFKVRLGLPNKTTGLFPGMYVKTAFLMGKKRSLMIPQQAVVFRSEVTGAYVLSPKGKVSFRHIRLGHETNDKMIEVLAGLDQGERVALDPVAAGTMLKGQIKETNGG